MVRGALQAVDAAALVDRALAAPSTRAWLAGGPLVVIAAGKAAGAMAGTLVGRHPGARGLVSAPDANATAVPGLDCYRAGHPLPNDESYAAGRRALEVAASTTAADRLVVLLSGGASALLAVPADGLSLADKIGATQALLAAGAEIHALNAVRKHLSGIKGGRLAAAAEARLLTLAISDVVGPVPDDPSAIGSGPTAPDPTTFREALKVVARTVREGAFPLAARTILEEGLRGERAESPKPGDPRLARADWRVIGNRHDAMRGARVMAETLGYEVVVLEPPVIGEARDAGRQHAARLRAYRQGARGPMCVVSSGETTVRVVGRGRGGRNQEFALALAMALGPTPGIALASVGTDGIDGPTDAAGAIVDTETMTRAHGRGLDPQAHLLENDAYPFFAALDDLVVTGPTHTNVGDLQIAVFG